MLKNLTQNNKTSKYNNLVHDENQYLNLIYDIINEGTMVNSRNGNALTVYGSVMHFDLTNNKIPILTTKKTAWKTCLKELFWFIKGCTNNQELKDQNVKIWDGNSSREYLDSIGLTHYEENDLGPVYGHQWRHFNAQYENRFTDYNNKGIDQLKYIIDCLKDPNKRYSRRLIMSAWNPCQINEMALPPCHILCQFNVIGNELSCSMYQRSCDVGLGVPFNIASYAFLTCILAKHCDLIPKDFCYNMGNCHIYDDHIEMLKMQMKHIPYNFPNIEIKNKHENIDDYCLEDIEISNYESHKQIKMVMRV